LSGLRLYFCPPGTSIPRP